MAFSLVGVPERENRGKAAAAKRAAPAPGNIYVFCFQF